MQNLRKFVSILVILSFFILMFAACGSSGNEQGTDGKSDSSDEGDKTVGADEVRPPDLPDIDYGGIDFVMLTRYDPTPGWGWGNRDVTAESENGEEINDAVFRRNAMVEEKYNVNITAIEVELHLIQTTNLI